MTYFDMPDQGGDGLGWLIVSDQPSDRDARQREIAVWRDSNPGWFELVDELDRHLGYVSPQYRIDQIKEKFGGLRFYAKFVPHSDDSPERVRVAAQLFRRLIDETERRSWDHCDQCGDPANLYQTSEGWLYTACVPHVRDENDERVTVRE